jgi:MFS family permease
MLAAYGGGGVADRLPRVWLIVSGWSIYAITYLGLGLADRELHVWLAFLFYGLYHGLTEPAEKALVKDLAPVSLRGRAYGAYNFIIGITAIPAGLLTGYLWQRFGALTALGTGSAVAALAAAALFAWQLETRAQHPG